MMDQYLTIQEVCTLLRLSERTIYRMCREGSLPGAAKVGGSWRVSRAELESWLVAGGEASVPRPVSERLLPPGSKEP